MDNNLFVNNDSNSVPPVINDVNKEQVGQPIDFLTVEPTPPLANQNYQEDVFIEQEDNKKRNKLILIILLLLLLLGLGSYFGYNWYQNKKYDDWLQKIRDAAREHVDHDSEVKDAILDGEQDKIIIKDIISDGYLVNDDLINPKTGKHISTCNFVEVKVEGEVIKYLNVTINNETCPGGKPFIVMKGAKEVRITINNTYKDAGANGYDADGTNISSLMEIRNEVNNKLAGEYTVTYNLTNSQGISATPVIRYVIVEPKANTIPPKTVTVGDRIKPSINMPGLSATIKVGDKYNYSIVFTDNVQLKKVTYCTPNCKSEDVTVKSLKRTFTFIGSKAGTYTIKATAVDKSGNTLTLARTIRVTDVVDKIAPTAILVSAPTEMQRGDTETVMIRFEDNIGIAAYVACVGNVCVERTLSVPKQIVIVPIEVTPTTLNDLQITAMARDTSGNFFPNSRLGFIKVTTGEVSNATIPRVTLVSAPAAGIVGQPLSITVKYEGVNPQKISKYKFCAQLNGVNNCTEGLINPPVYEKIVVHQYTPSVAGTYRFTAMGINMAGQYSGNIYLKDVIIK